MKAKKSSTETEQKDSKKALAVTRKYKGTCTFCGKIGHKAIDCYMRKNKEKAQEKMKRTMINRRMPGRESGVKRRSNYIRTTSASFVRNLGKSCKIADRRRLKLKPQM